MDYKKLEDINKLLKTIDVKGKNYVEVNERIKAFWQLCPNGRIYTQIVTIDNGICVIKAEVYENMQEDYPRATGIAYEKEGSTFINKTSYIENCETSAVGRALGNAGIGIDTSVASAEEVQNAIKQQENEVPKLSSEEIKILEATEKKYNLSGEEVAKVLKKYGYTSYKDVTKSNYAKIGNELSKGGEK